MSTSLARTLQSDLQQLIIGGPLYDASGNLPNMVVYPVFPTGLAPDPTGMITLSEGLRRGVRLSDTGMVSQVHVHNPLPAPVLVGESEILLGPTQLRSVQFSCLIPPERRASLPVSCVEAGQPTVHRAEFTDSDACPWFLRSFKIEQLARHGEPHQHLIWERIREYLQGAGTTSSTQDLRAVFRDHGADVESLSRNFPPAPGQTGAICAVGHDLFFELFSDPELLEDRYEQTLHSAVIEAVAHPGADVPPADQVHGLFEELASASVNSRVVHNRSVADAGRTVVFSDRGLSGSALMAGGRLVHLSAHKRCLGFGRPFAEQLPVLESERAAWQTEHGAFSERLQREYGRRRSRYTAFKNSLGPTRAGVQPAYTPESEDEGRETDLSAAPVPLNTGIHRFFMNLFHR